MNVCDLCKETPLEDEKVQVSFRYLKKYLETFKSLAGSDLNSCKEICPGCCIKLLKLFKKGGDKE